ncbi:phage tail protein [Microbacterium sp. ZW T5_45]|uniref:phage tail protein n=1 Tax=Microbacterium sp. ZW T5_45 TaxID=3378080 RepID=UPI003851B3E9
MDPFLGEIRRVAFPFTPIGWAPCNGQMLNIAQNQALYSLLGVRYGGNGTTTFALPDLRGRGPVHSGTTIALGQTGGAESVTLTQIQIPAHTHQVIAAAAGASAASPQGGYWATTADAAYGTGAAGTLAASAVSTTGASAPHQNEPPFLVLNYIIALSGIYPSRG